MLVVITPFYHPINHRNKIICINHILGSAVFQTHLKQVNPIVVNHLNSTLVQKTIHIKSKPSIIGQCCGALKAPRKHYHQLTAKYLQNVLCHSHPDYSQEISFSYLNERHLLPSASMSMNDTTLRASEQ